MMRKIWGILFFLVVFSCSANDVIDTKPFVKLLENYYAARSVDAINHDWNGKADRQFWAKTYGDLGGISSDPGLWIITKTIEITNIKKAFDVVDWNTGTKGTMYEAAVQLHVVGKVNKDNQIQKLSAAKQFSFVFVESSTGYKINMDSSSWGDHFFLLESDVDQFLTNGKVDAESKNPAQP